METKQLSFFNSINLTGNPLAEATETAKKQGDRILEIMKDGRKRTPFMVWRVYNRKYPEIPITSVRRAMTVLTNQGKLEMLDEMKVERYGMKNHLWIISE